MTRFRVWGLGFRVWRGIPLERSLWHRGFAFQETARASDDRTPHDPTCQQPSVLALDS